MSFYSPYGFYPPPFPGARFKPDYGFHNHYKPVHVVPEPKFNVPIRPSISRPQDKLISALTKRVTELEHKRMRLFNTKAITELKTKGYSVNDTQVTDDKAWGEIDSTTGLLSEGATGVPISVVNVINGREGFLALPPTALTTAVNRTAMSLDLADVYPASDGKYYDPKAPLRTMIVDRYAFNVHICGCGNRHCCHHGCRVVRLVAYLRCEVTPAEGDTPASNAWSVLIPNMAYLPVGTLIPWIKFRFMTKDKYEITVEKATADASPVEASGDGGNSGEGGEGGDGGEGGEGGNGGEGGEGGNGGEGGEGGDDPINP